MLLICPVREGDDNEELRYALRSWEANLIMPLRLLIVGYKPSWLEPDNHLPGNRHDSIMANVWDNVYIGCVNAAFAGWEEALIMNDDFFCLDPMGSVLPVRREFRLLHHVDMARRVGGWWFDSLDLTASWLSREGYPSPWSYEAHRPLPCKPQAMVSALERWEGSDDGVFPQWRTIYGTLMQIDAYPVKDGKVTTRSPALGNPWFSTSDHSWLVHGGWIRDRFQKPSRWER